MTLVCLLIGILLLFYSINRLDQRSQTVDDIDTTDGAYAVTYYKVTKIDISLISFSSALVSFFALLTVYGYKPI
jgi:hypothetical protein